MADGQKIAAPVLSAVVVARNEEDNLGACLDALRFADEIVVVLDRSSDRSAAIAQGFGARVIEGAWELEGPRRNAALDACRGDWILEVDADERVTPALAAAVRAAIAAPQADYYLVPFLNHVGGRPVRYGWGAYNGVSATVRLSRKGAKTWGAGRVHPKVHFTGTRGLLEAEMIHYVDRDISDMFERLNRDTDRAALDAIENGTAPSLAGALRRILSRSWKSYVGRKGYREGATGVALATFSALYPLMIYLKVKTAKPK